MVKDWKNYEPPSTPVDKAVVVRAVAMDGENNISEIVTATYFVALEQYEDEDVLSVVAEPDALFGEDGIYVTGKEYDDWYLGGGVQEEPEPNFIKGGRRREIEGSIEFYESGRLSFNQSIGLRIQGESARQISKKRFSVFARRAYGGSDYFDQELFEGRKIHSVVLREGFANAVIPCLLTDRHIGVQSARPVTVFLNGEYWYTTYIQEKFSSHYLSEKYGVDRKNIFIIKNAYVDNGKNSDINYYLELQDYFEQNDFSAEEAYEEAGRIIDIQSYIDFFCANVYLGNIDMWEGHNYVLWRSYEDRGTGYEDGRWRWLLYDLDCAGIIDLEYYGLGNHAEINAFSAPMRYSLEHKTMNDMSIFAALRNNEEFKKQFVLTFMDMANTNFSFKHVEKILRAYGEDMNWHDGFFLKRFDYAVSDLAEEFSLHGTLEELTVKIEHPEAGSVQVNTCMPDFSERVWTGKYYTDYPVILQAVPSEGYVFAGWKGDVSSNEGVLSVDLNEGAKVLEAVFERRDQEE